MTCFALNRENGGSGTIRWAAARAPKRAPTTQAFSRVAVTMQPLQPRVYIGQLPEVRQSAWVARLRSRAAAFSSAGISELQIAGPRADAEAALAAYQQVDDAEDTLSIRLAELRALADEEDVAWNAAAEDQLRHFMRMLPRPSRPAIAVDANGDLRALWDNMLREQVGIRFKGELTLEAVLFQRTEHGFRREVLRAGPVAVIRLIAEMKLVHVTRG